MATGNLDEEEVLMARPARRGRSALGAVLDTLVNVLTLPFRVLGRLFRPRRTHPAR
jgi:hypothetical protein